MTIFIMVTLALLLLLALFLAGVAGCTYVGWLGLWKLGTTGKQPPRQLKLTALAAIAVSIICIATFGLTAPTKPTPPRGAAAEPLVSIPPAQQPAPIPPVVAIAPPPVPEYCSAKAAARLLECGWTEEKQRQLVAEDKAAAEAKAQHDAAEAYRYVPDPSGCNRPIGQMSPAAIDACR